VRKTLNKFKPDAFMIHKRTSLLAARCKMHFIYRNFTSVIVYQECIVFDWEKKSLEKSNLDMGVAN